MLAAMPNREAEAAGALGTLAVKGEGWVARRTLDKEAARPMQNMVDVELAPTIGPKVPLTHNRFRELIADQAAGIGADPRHAGAHCPGFSPSISRDR